MRFILGDAGMRMQTLAVAAALILSGAMAFAQDVKVDFDTDVNLGALKTFSLKIGTSWGNPLSEKRVIGEIEQALTEKGWDEGRRRQGRHARGPARRDPGENTWATRDRSLGCVMSMSY